jgi:hypothetical protein
MFPSNFFVSYDTGKKMASLGYEKSMYRYFKNEESYNDIEILESNKPLSMNQLKTAVPAPTLCEIPLSENGWRIFTSLRPFSILPEIELRAYVWITEKVLLGKKEARND